MGFPQGEGHVCPAVTVKLRQSCSYTDAIAGVQVSVCTTCTAFHYTEIKYYCSLWSFPLTLLIIKLKWYAN